MVLEKMPPYQFGGEMVDKVSFEKTTFNKVPFKFEAGTPNVGAALGLETAVKFIQNLDRKAVEEYEEYLLNYATERLSKTDVATDSHQQDSRTGGYSRRTRCRKQEYACMGKDCPFG